MSTSYEDVDTVPSAVEHQEQGLELKENVAYGPSKLDYWLLSDSKNNSNIVEVLYYKDNITRTYTMCVHIY